MMEQAMAQGNRLMKLKCSNSQRVLTLTHPNAAGIDIGSGSHFVAVPADRDEEPVREFASFTSDLQKRADWLEGCAVDTVAMESSGVYWIPLYELLEARGLTVLLVNARHAEECVGAQAPMCWTANGCSN
jgi:transposase